MKEFEVEVLATDPSGKLKRAEEIEGIRVRKFKSYAPSNAYFFSPELWSYLKKHSRDYDLIHAHNFHAFPALYAALSRPKKFVFTPHYHGHAHSFFRNLLFGIYRLYARRIFHQANAVICVSRFERELILRDFKPKRVELIPNGVNFDFAEKRKAGNKILFVGRIEKYKGLDFVVKALKILPEFRLKIVGDGSYKGKIIKLAKRLGVLERVSFFQDLSREELVKR